MHSKRIYTGLMANEAFPSGSVYFTSGNLKHCNYLRLAEKIRRKMTEQSYYESGKQTQHFHSRLMSEYLV